MVVTGSVEADYVKELHPGVLRERQGLLEVDQSILEKL